MTIVTFASQIDGMTGHAIYLQSTGLPTSISGTHMELNTQGDIQFYKDGRQVQRLFEDEKGLYLENMQTGAVSRLFLESDLAPFATRVYAQQKALDSLAQQLDVLRADMADVARAGKADASRPAD